MTDTQEALTETERSDVAEAFEHDAEATCWRANCDAGLWHTVARIKAEAVQAERDRLRCDCCRGVCACGGKRIIRGES